MVVSRTRSKFDSVSGGQWVTFDGSTFPNANSDISRKRIFDFIGKQARTVPTILAGTVEATPMELTEVVHKPMFLNGSNSFVSAHNVIIGGQDVFNGSWHQYLDSYYRYAYSDPDYAIKTIARTNPGRPVLSVPVFIRELLDIGSMFKFAAQSFLGFAGGAYLNYRFGWLTFINDLQTLAGILKVIEARTREFQHLTQHGGLRRSVKLMTHTPEIYEANAWFNSTWGVWVTGTAHWQHISNIRGTVRWTCTRDFAADLEKLGGLRVAFKQVFDLESIDPATLWELVPWTWLVDYFSSIGPFLAAHEDSGDFDPHDLCIIWDTESKLKLVAKDVPVGFSASNATVSGRAYSRSTPELPPFPPARLGLITEPQINVLLALLAKFIGK